MNYQKYSKKAYVKIKQYGSPVKCIFSGGRKYNPDTNSYDDETKELNGYGLQSSFTLNNIDGTNIRIGDILITCVLNGVPKTNDVIILQDKEYTVVNVNQFSPDGKTDIYFKIQAR